MNNYLRPVAPTNGRMSTYRDHTRRTTPSLEAGVDYYCPIGTRVVAAGNGRVFAAAGTVRDATGRYVTIDLDDGRRVRYLHLSRWNVEAGDRVKRGQVVGLSGASGYGTEYFGATGPSAIPANTGGPHVHTTLWAGHYYRFGRFPLEPTLDFERYVSGSPAGGGSSPLNPEEDEMSAKAEAQIEAVYKAIFGPNNPKTSAPGPLKFYDIGGTQIEANYGVLSLVLHNQTLIAQQAGTIAGLVAAVDALSKKTGGGTIDLAAIEAAAEKGAADAFKAIAQIVADAE